MNLRLGPNAQEAVRQEAERTGRSQQDVIRDAVDGHLGLSSAGSGTGRGASYERRSSEAISPPRHSFRRSEARLVLPRGVTTAKLLDRDDRA